MEPFKKLIPFEEARDTILKNIKPVERIEATIISKAVSRILAEEIIAPMPVPPFNRASMDGFALRAEETYGASTFKPKIFQLIGAAFPGEPFQGKIKEGECIQIATGSPIPMGANAVVMVEYTKEEEGKVEIIRPIHPGGNIAPKGEDIEEGEQVLNSGDYLTSPRIGALAAIGRKTVKVYAKPRVSIISTGKEVREVGHELREGEVYDINSYTLSSMVTANGATSINHGIIPDTHKELNSVIKEAIKNDMIVFSGGSSVGVRDILYKIISKIGKVVFHGVQVKPGKPTLFGLVQGKAVLGMPGYPTSCLSNAYLFLVPAIRKMARMPQREPRRIKTRMGHRFVSSSGRVQFLTVKIREGNAYQAFKESGAITSMSEADGYILIPLNVDVIEEGEEVIVTLLE
jgi:molybdenum cofactor synthesis domain-containing protein